MNVFNNMQSTSERTASKQRGLHWYLALIVFLGIAVPAAISGGFLISKSYKRAVDQESQHAADSYADLLEAGLAIPMWNVSPELAKPLLESILVDKSVSAISVFADDGKPFLNYNRSGANSNSRFLNIERDVVYKGENLGRFELTYSLENAFNRATSDAQFLAVVIVVQLVFSQLAISLALHRRVLEPLKKLGSAAAGIAKGDLKTTIPELERDEFGDLAIQLEKMRGVLEENFTQLEKRVDERTTELQAVNSALKGTLDRLQQTQDNLIQSEKLAALGSLVAGVAHELNTPIGNGLTVATSLTRACDEIKTRFQSGLTKSALERFITDMDEGTCLVNRNLEKASELVSSFKQVAMDRTSAQRRKFSINAILQETQLTVSPAFKRTPYIVEMALDEDATMDSYPGPLGQVITNLLNNALIHAFDNLDSGKVLIKTRVKRDGVDLWVTDNGKGIPAENIGKIFDPFFTTKLGEGGNGLGMHIVHNIVTAVLGGNIHVESTVGEGTEFHLFLPFSAPKDNSALEEDKH